MKNCRITFFLLCLLKSIQPIWYQSSHIRIRKSVGSHFTISCNRIHLITSEATSSGFCNLAIAKKYFANTCKRGFTDRHAYSQKTFIKNVSPWINANFHSILPASENFFKLHLATAKIRIKILQKL